MLTYNERVGFLQRAKALVYMMHKAQAGNVECYIVRKQDRDIYTYIRVEKKGGGGTRRFCRPVNADARRTYSLLLLLATQQDYIERDERERGGRKKEILAPYSLPAQQKQFSQSHQCVVVLFARSAFFFSLSLATSS